eukprot:tig00000808_g4386.t1
MRLRHYAELALLRAVQVALAAGVQPWFIAFVLARVLPIRRAVIRRNVSAFLKLDARPSGTFATRVLEHTYLNLSTLLAIDLSACRCSCVPRSPAAAGGACAAAAGSAADFSVGGGLRIDFDGAIPATYFEDLDAGRGVILVTAHLGAWEALIFVRELAGSPPRPFNVAYKPLHNSLLDDWLLRLRSRSGARLLPSAGALPSMEAALGRGEIVGMVADQLSGRARVPASFLGRTTLASPGLGLLHARTGAPVWFAALLRNSSRSEKPFRLFMERVAEGSRAGDPGASVEATVQAFFDTAAKYVAAFPDQYLWAYDLLRRCRQAELQR